MFQLTVGSSFRFLVLVMFLTLSGAVSVFSQVTEAMLRQQLVERGIDEGAFRQKLKERGILYESIDQVPPEEYPQIEVIVKEII
ncbi:MAG: hypothetical protein KDC80_30725, partial [Saprospiraceae bacterium]|nr:hypothetical protein [Saprospiraceae bacterium]